MSTQDFALLTGERWIRFQESMRGVRWIIINEYSMVGQRLLGMVESRCREARPGAPGVRADLNVYLFGDLAQLPPVKSKPIYSLKAKSHFDLRGVFACRAFRHAIVLSESQRQADPGLRGALDELRARSR